MAAGRNLLVGLLAACGGCMSHAEDVGQITQSFGAEGGSLPAGRFSLQQDLRIPGTVQLAPGARIELPADRTLTLEAPPEAGRRQLFAGPGRVRFESPGVVYPEWWGVSNESIQHAIDASAPGSRIELTGRYDSVPLSMSLPGDEGKSLAGTGGPGERFDDSQGGASIYLVDGADDHVLRIAGTSEPADRAGIVLRDLKINGNRRAQKRGHCLSISQVKDILIDNLFLEDCYEDGLNASERGVNQIESLYLEVQSAGRDGVSLGAAADSNFVVLKTGTNGRFGLQASGGSNQFGAVQSYLNGRDGVLVSGDNKRFSVVRADENGEAGVRIVGSGNTFEVVEASDNGRSRSERAGRRSGLHLGADSSGNQFGFVAARSKPGRDWQKATVYLASTGTANVISGWRTPDEGQMLLDLAEQRVNPRVLSLHQRAVQTLAAAPAAIIDPWLGQLVEVNGLSGEMALGFAPHAAALDGHRLTLVVRQGRAGRGRLRWPEDSGIRWQPDPAGGATSSIDLVVLNGRWQILGQHP